MFLSTALREKLKRDYLEGDTDEQEGGARFRYEPHSPDKRLLINFRESIKANAKDPTPFNRLNSQQLKALEKKEWENTFTLRNLHARWKGSTNLDFDNNFKKFTDDVVPQSVKETKQFIKDFIDPDILEKKQKYFNLSTDTGKEVRPELKKTLFEASQGLNNFQIVPLKKHIINEGVDSRDHLTVDNGTWNTSNLIDEDDFKQKYKEDLVLAQDNSFRYWKDNEDNRNLETKIPIRKEREKVEMPRYFKKYKSPYQRSVDYYRSMNKIKESTILEKENIEKNILHDYPYLSKCPEKLNALVFKEMGSIYKNKYNDYVNKTTQLKINEEMAKRDEPIKFKWNDKDLANKIIAINKLEKSGILKNEKNNNTKYSRLTISFDRKKNDYLLPLVIKGQTIYDEEDKIQERIREEELKKQKKELLLQEKKFNRVLTPKKFVSKYPLNKEEYAINKKIDLINSMDNSNLALSDLERKILINKFSITPSKKQTDQIMNEISTSSGCGPHFLEAYCKIANQELEKIKENNKKIKENVTYKYSHPGTYRAFNYTEKIAKPKPEKKKEEFIFDDNPEKVPATEYIEKKVTEYCWSCCMNSDKNSPGCQKIPERNFKYLYN
jgi:hypothetical protein